MESGSVLSEPLTLPHRGFPTERSASMTIISSKGHYGQPRMSQLENLEAKMANIEVSLSASNPGRRRKGTSLGGTISARSSPRPEVQKEMRSALQDREAVIQNLRVQLGLGKLPRPTGPPLDDTERPAAEQKLSRLKIDAENKRIAIRNLKSALDKLDITDNIDIRIRQAELEYALGREELQLLSLVEEARALQSRLDKSKPEANTLYSIIQSGVSLSLHAVQATVGRFAASPKADSSGLYVEWALDGEGLYRGDRVLELNGKIVTYRTREEFQKAIGTAGKCQLVVIRKKASAIPQQQLIQQQEDNLRLQHRISYLEEQVRELQTAKEPTSTPITNGVSGHVTSISISSPPSTPPEKPQVFQRGNYVTTLVGGKPIELNSHSPRSHVTKTIIKENGSHTDTENGYMSGPMKSLSASKISINSDLPSHNHKRVERRERYNERNGGLRNNKLSEVSHHLHHHHHLTPLNGHSYSHARSVEHLNYNGIDRRKEPSTIEHIRKFGNDLRSVKSLDFENELNDKKRNIDYTSEPVAPRIRPTPPKKPLRLSLQRAQSLQTVELNQLNEMDSKKRSLKRAHISEKVPESSYIENSSPLQTASLGRHKHI